MSTIKVSISEESKNNMKESFDTINIHEEDEENSLEIQTESEDNDESG